MFATTLVYGSDKRTYGMREGWQGGWMEKRRWSKKKRDWKKEEAPRNVDEWRKKK